MKYIEMKFTNVLIAIAILINYSSAKPTRSLGENNEDDASIFPLNIKVLQEDGLKYGNVLLVECSADSPDITDMKWVRESFKNRAHVNHYDGNKILMTINGIIPMDFGKYTCIAIRSDGIQVKKSIRIERNPNFGNRFRYRLDDEKKSSDGGESLTPGKLIGNEEVPTHNLIGSISDQTDVRIQQDFQTYTHEGETVTFTCLINDEDRADVAWTRNHGLMPRNHRVINNTLILFNITSSDTGYYICSYGDKSTYVYLGLVRRDFPITYVKIPSKAKQINVVEGDSVEIDCVTVGELKTNLRWEKHQSKLPENHVVENNKLKLTNVQVENYGYYECLGENALGNFSDFVYLDVKNKTELLARQKTTSAAKEEEEEESTTQATETTTVENGSDNEVIEDSNEETDESEVDTSSDATPEETQNSNESNDGEISNEADGNNEVESEQTDQLTTTPVAVTEPSEEAIASTEASSVEEITTTTVVAPSDPVQEEVQQTQSAEPEASTELPAVTTTNPADVTEPVAQEVTQPVETEAVQTEAVQTTTPVVQEEIASSTEAAPAEGSSDGDVSVQETTSVPAEETVTE